MFCRKKIVANRKKTLNLSRYVIGQTPNLEGAGRALATLPRSLSISRLRWANYLCRQGKVATQEGQFLLRAEQGA